jgi:hypothetical protein
MAITSSLAIAKRGSSRGVGVTFEKLKPLIARCSFVGFSSIGSLLSMMEFSNFKSELDVVVDTIVFD